jgi:4-hydroxybenzoate polyprenyltransferase
MKLIAAFMKLIRWPNLVFIGLTQWLFYFAVFFSLYHENAVIYNQLNSSYYLFYLLMLASVLIAAAGYIINDYFDIQIDTVNKPEKNVVDRIIKRRWVIVWHWIFSLLGILISIYVSAKTGKWLIGILNIFAVLLLWFYSTHFKRMLIVGNVVIAALTGWVIVVVYFFAGATLLNFRGWNPEVYPFNVKLFYKLTMLYAGFAFVMTLIREVIKDLEDMLGDARYNCKTIPIVWGVPATKVYTGVWITVSMASLLIVQLYAWQSGWWWSTLYCLLFIILPLGLVFKSLLSAKSAADYHRISNLIKLVMLAGILSMIFFNFLF